MFMVELSFATHSAAEPHPAYFDSSFGIVEVDVSPMLQDVCAEGDTAQVSAGQRDVTTCVKVHSYSSTFSSW